MSRKSLPDSIGRVRQRTIRDEPLPRCHPAQIWVFIQQRNDLLQVFAFEHLRMNEDEADPELRESATQVAGNVARWSPSK